MLLPLIDTPFTIQLSELRDQRKLLSGDSDLAELDRATDGAIGRKLVQAFQAPLPLPVKAFAQQSVGSPLVNQVLLLLSSVVLVEGVRQPMDSKALAASLATSQAKGSLNLLDVLEALPGESASVDLHRVILAIDRVTNQQRLGQSLVTSLPAAGINPALIQTGPLAVKRQELAIPVQHRPNPLQVVTIQPVTGATRCRVAAAASTSQPGRPASSRAASENRLNAWMNQSADGGSSSASRNQCAPCLRLSSTRNPPLATNSSSDHSART